MSWNCFVPWSEFSIQFILQPLPVYCSPLLLPNLALQMAIRKTLSTLKNATYWNCQFLIWLSIQISLFHRLIYKGTMFYLCFRLQSYLCSMKSGLFIQNLPEFLCWCSAVMYFVNKAKANKVYQEITQLWKYCFKSWQVTPLARFSKCCGKSSQWGILWKQI